MIKFITYYIAFQLNLNHQNLSSKLTHYVSTLMKSWFVLFLAWITVFFFSCCFVFHSLLRSGGTALRVAFRWWNINMISKIVKTKGSDEKIKRKPTAFCASRIFAKLNHLHTISWTKWRGKRKRKWEKKNLLNPCHHIQNEIR